ncbi:restriction endonuclease family protein [Lyngbya aestuarii BL J]|uniref:Restriction endonuclease family protein n=1 Tax=Lyngbya aestuarii BL J TaxID=1348334 RepID=U7QB76_9CYAN|nr:Uma2 family endonuclease [Lyngbya aestuarii]ERT05109.1 restriction endonuclease family protein [Lyngbya aestuarii BL J]
MTAISPNEKKKISIPPLENGDSLTRPEFERRYSNMPHLKKAELIEGIVYMASPLRFESHAEPHANLMIWLGTYKVATSGVRLGDNPTVKLDLDNESQPDIVLLIDSQYGGQSRLNEEGYIEGAPELIAEISASTATIDLRDKKRAYRRNGVQEYIVWQVSDRKLDWFCLEGGDYISLQPKNDIIQSRIFPGLWLAVTALLAGEMSQVITTLQTGLASSEYQAFQQKLKTD